METDNHLSKCVDIIDQIESQTTVDGAFNLFKHFTQSIGGTSLLIGQMTNPILVGKTIEDMGRTDWPVEFFKEWVNNGLVFSDPIAQLSRNDNRSFEWSKAYDLANNHGKAIMDRARDFGLENGIVITIPSYLRSSGVVSVGYGKTRPSPNDILMLELISAHSYAHISELLGLNEKEETSQLTVREREIMHFVASGKTNWEISKILAVSERTIINHLANITAKLNVSNRAHAVTIGLKSGQLML